MTKMRVVLKWWTFDLSPPIKPYSVIFSFTHLISLVSKPIQLPRRLSPPSSKGNLIQHLMLSAGNTYQDALMTACKTQEKQTQTESQKGKVYN